MTDTLPLSGADAAYRKIAARILPLLVVCYILAYIDRQNIGFAKLQFMDQLGFSAAVYGLGGGLFYLGYSLFEVPSNLMLKRIGARATMLRIMVGWGLVATLFAFMQTPVHFYILRFLLGVAEAGFFPGVLLYISFWVPRSRRATFTATFMAAMPISSVISAPLSGAIMESMGGIGGMAGWQWMFVIQGVPSVIMAFIVYRLLPNRPADAKWLSAEEKDGLQKELEADEQKAGHPTHPNFLAALTNWRLYGLAAMSFSLISSIAGLQLWLPTLIQGAGVTDLLQLGGLAALPPLVAIFAQQFNARRSDRAQERRWHAAVPTLVAAGGFSLIPFVQGNLILSIVCLTVISVGLYSATGPYWTLPSTQLSGAAAAGGIAIVTTIGGLGAFVSSWLAGILVEWTGSPNSGLLYYAGLSALGAVLMLLATKPAGSTAANPAARPT